MGSPNILRYNAEKKYSHTKVTKLFLKQLTLAGSHLPTVNFSQPEGKSSISILLAAAMLGSKTAAKVNAANLLLVTNMMIFACNLKWILITVQK